MDRCTQVFPNALLLDEHVSGRQVDIHKVGVVHHHLVLEFDERVWVFDPEYFLQQFEPELLRIAFLISCTAPLRGKSLCCCGFLLIFGHFLLVDFESAKIQLFSELFTITYLFLFIV